MAELKPCPFCGNPAKLRYGCDKREITDLWCVQCENELCYAMTGWAGATKNTAH